MSRNGAELDVNRLQNVMEASLRIRLRHHFFNWTQGPLQTVLSHDVLICGIFDHRAGGYRVDSFSCYPLPKACIERMSSAEDGIVQRLVQAWDKNDRYPLLLDAQVVSGFIVNVAADLVQHQLDNLVAHGTCGLNGPPGTFFGFCRIPGALTQQHVRTAELLVPYLHAVWTRILHGETPAEREISPAAGSRLLTSRELEILRWIYEGKSNMEIGAILGISGFTVKNHVQNILRKLKVQNRAQAVGRGLLLDLLQSPSHG